RAFVLDLVDAGEKVSHCETPLLSQNMERFNLALFGQKENARGLLTYDFLRISNG
ncbi:MAG: hypothetical protein K0Q91_2221, partial [Fibrobacteria bacterium]|nr:hypothetical protein [Fibrobacteria bacterium]